MRDIPLMFGFVRNASGDLSYWIRIKKMQNKAI